MVDLDKIAAARAAHAARTGHDDDDTLAMLTEFLFQMDDTRSSATLAGGPRLQFIETEEENDSTLITARIEPNHLFSEAIWSGGLTEGLWIHSHRMGTAAAGDADWHAQMRERVLAVAVSALGRVTDPDTGLARIERTTHAVDTCGHTYTLRRVTTGPHAGQVDFVQGWVDTDWTTEQLQDPARAKDYGYEDAHLGLTRIQTIIDSDHQTIVDIAAEGNFDLDEEQRTRLTAPVPDADHVASLGDLVAVHGYLPWDHRQEAT